MPVSETKWTLGKLAVELGMPPDALRKQIAHLKPLGKLGGRAYHYNFEQVMRAVYAPVASDDNPDRLSPRERRLLADAILQETKVAEIRGQLLRVEDVRHIVAEILQALDADLESFADAAERDLQLPPEAIDYIVKRFDALRESLANSYADACERQQVDNAA